MFKEINPDFGFQAGVQKEKTDLTGKLQAIGLTAVRKKFSPEFVNRIDAVITYQSRWTRRVPGVHSGQPDPPAAESRQQSPGAALFHDRRAEREPRISAEGGNERAVWGARAEPDDPPSAHSAAGDHGGNGSNRAGREDPGRSFSDDKGSLIIHTVETDVRSASAHPTVLIVDDNRDLLRFLERLMAQSGWKLLTAETAEAGLAQVAREKPHVALLDYVLPDGNGVALGVKIRETAPGIPVIIMSGAELPGKEQITCEEHDFQILQKPFLAKMRSSPRFGIWLTPDSLGATPSWPIPKFR